jgi:phosphoribosylformimino-5-aminoimidazole carboxamide ribotide isomerase
MPEPSPKTLFRPCIDLHDGQVKQIVGGTLSDAPESLKTNFVASKPPRYYAELYRENGLEGGHVIMLGRGNTDAAREMLAAWPGELVCVQPPPGEVASDESAGGLQVGGGITDQNCVGWIEAGASKASQISVFRLRGSDPGAGDRDLVPLPRRQVRAREARARRQSRRQGQARRRREVRVCHPPEMSAEPVCVPAADGGTTAGSWPWTSGSGSPRWRSVEVGRVRDVEFGCALISERKESLDMLSRYCSEFLIHAADVEGLCQGIDEDLVRRECQMFRTNVDTYAKFSVSGLGEWVSIPTTYAGGAKCKSRGSLLMLNTKLYFFSRIGSTAG